MKASDFLCILGFALVWSLTVDAETFRPETAAAYAVRQNKDLAAARFVIAQAEGRLVQAGLWRNPEFEVGTEFDPPTRAALIRQ